MISIKPRSGSTDDQRDPVPQSHLSPHPGSLALATPLPGERGRLFRGGQLELIKTLTAAANSSALSATGSRAPGSSRDATIRN